MTKLIAPSSLLVVFILILTAAFTANSTAGQIVTSTPALPDCAKLKNAAERSLAVHAFVDQLETVVEKDPTLADKDEYKTLITLVSAQLLPETTPFRSFDLECWAHFEQARRELKDGKALHATHSAERWQRCLEAKADGLLSTAAPLLSCFGVRPKK